MKFIVSSAMLLNHLQAVGRVISSRNALPILDCFLLDLKDNTLSLTAADSEIRLVTQVEVNAAEGGGSLAINARNLLEPLHELPDQPLTFDINDETLEVFIYYHNGKYNFVGLKGDEYPEPKELKDASMKLSMKAETLFSAINRTIYATADDEMRPVMTGIYFDIADNGVTFVASDGHKLVRLINSEAKGEGPSSFILPKKAANLLKTLLPRETGVVTISFDENNAYIDMPSYHMVCRFVEGRYPNYNSVIPQNNPNTLIIDRLALLNALRRVSVFSNQSSSLVKLQLSDEMMVVSAKDIDFMTAAEEMIPCHYEGNVMNIGFKASFLIDILNNIPSSDVRIALSDPSRAGLILPVDQEENENMLTLLMPMMLND